VVLEPDCEERLMNRLKIQEDGFDGYYIRAVKRGCNIFSNPQKHAGRFVRAVFADSIVCLVAGFISALPGCGSFNRVVMLHAFKTESSMPP
jgi:hypothetical protein